MKIVVILAVLQLVASTNPSWAADSKGSKAGGKSSKSSGEDLFATPKVLRLTISLPASAAEALRSNPKQYVKGTIREGDKVYEDVGIRVKGSAAFEGLEKKPSLAIKFNEFVKDQEFHGRGRVLLSNAHKDPTYMCEAIGGAVFRAAGVPAAKTTYATLEADGRDLGLYVISEAANKDFLSQYFKKAKGNLYEGSSNDISDKLEKDGGDSSTDQDDLKALAAALRESDLAERWRRLTPLLDVERFAAFAAAEVLMGHHDGYTMDKNNYRVYHDPATGQMVFIPHGLDQLYSKSDEPLIPEWKGLAAKAVLSAPAGQRQYFDKMSELIAGGAKSETISQLIDDLASLIRPVLAGSNAASTKAFDDSVARLRASVAARNRFIQQQLKSLPPSK